MASLDVVEPNLRDIRDYIEANYSWVGRPTKYHEDLEGVSGLFYASFEKTWIQEFLRGQRFYRV